MRCLVTGATGFLGTAWCRALEVQGRLVVGVNFKVPDLTQANLLAQYNCASLGYDFGKIVFDTSRYVDVRSKCLRIRGLHRVMPGACLTDLTTGLQQTIDWFWQERDRLLI